MYARRNWLAYLAIGLGLAALIVSITGSMEGPRGGMPTMGGYGRRNGSAAVAPGTQNSAAVPAAPSAPQGAVAPQLGTDRSTTGPGRAGHGLTGDVQRSPFGHPFGGVLPLVGGLLVMGLGLALFIAPGRRGRPGGQQGGPGAGQPVSGEQDRPQGAAVYQAAVPQAQPASPAVVPAPPQTPPAPAHTGETTRLYDF